MKLSARPLIEVANVNSFDVATQVEFSVGDTFSFYFQLTDLEKNRVQYGWNPPGLRYVAATDATLALTFQNIDRAKEFVRAASRPFAADGSIWSVPLLATDPLHGTVSIRAVLTEGGVARSFSIQGCLLGQV
jgi:hypothetical protein